MAYTAPTYSLAVLFNLFWGSTELKPPPLLTDIRGLSGTELIYEPYRQIKGHQIRWISCVSKGYGGKAGEEGAGVER